MKIAIFDYLTIKNNPIGSCNFKIANGLYNKHEFTLYANEIDPELIGKVNWIRIPVIRRPLFLFYITYLISSTVIYYFRKFINREKFDIIQGVESKSFPQQISYAHFCHTAFLSEHWKFDGLLNIRNNIRWLDHYLHSRFEAITYNRARKIVVPSLGLKKEIERYFPGTDKKISVISNPVDLTRMQVHDDFDICKFRASINIRKDEKVIIFIALGHFERKGLSLLLEALDKINRPDIKLLIVGGSRDLIAHWSKRISTQHPDVRVVFMGMQKDVRPYFWISDIFVLPSQYEIFPLVALEAAAAGLILITSQLYGVEEFLVNGVNGYIVERDSDQMSSVIEAAIGLNSLEAEKIRNNAMRSVEKYSLENFIFNWQEVYENNV